MAPLIVTAALIKNEGKILVTRRRPDVPYPELWEFPGGKLEASEDPRDCIVREIDEELGIKVIAESIFDVVFYRYPERDVLVLVYRCSWTSGTPTNREVAEHRWVASGELKNLDFLPADIPLVERLILEPPDEDPSLLHITRSI